MAANWKNFKSVCKPVRFKLFTCDVSEAGTSSIIRLYLCILSIGPNMCTWWESNLCYPGLLPPKLYEWHYSNPL